MKAVCAWCESEGRPSDLGEREPFYNPATTHCICPDHQQRLLRLLPSKSFPDAEVLLVVRLNDTALYDYLQRVFAGLPEDPHFTVSPKRAHSALSMRVRMSPPFSGRGDAVHAKTSRS